MEPNVDTVSRIKESLDYKYYRSNFNIGLIMLAVLFFLIGLPSLALWPYQPYATVIMMLLPVFMSSIVWGYSLYKMRYLCKDPDSYVIYSASLKTPYPVYKNRVSFRVYFDNGASVDSAGIFTDSVAGNMSFAKWDGKTVSVAYDEKQERIVILG